jgi:hypothetical protein
MLYSQLPAEAAILGETRGTVAWRLALLLLAPAGVLYPQSTTGTILGTIKDTMGAVISGVRVRVTNEGTGISMDTLTNSTGDYVVPNLPAAVYGVQAEAPGFRKARVEHISLLLNATVRNDIRLEPGVFEQTVTVTAEAPVVNSDTSSISSVVDSHSVQNLPLDGRTLDQLVLLTAGNTSDSANNPRLAGSQYWGGNYYSVDGVAFNDTGNGGAAYSYSTRLTTTPSVDTVQEVKVEANNAKAEHEGSAAVSMITRSGQNVYHGSLYEYNRNRALTAKDFFATSQPKPQFNRNEFGGTFNGPVIKSKMFFFGSYEGLRQRTGRPPYLNVPPAALREGNFGRTRIRDPLSGANFPDNLVPADRIDPRARKLLEFVPLPNSDDPARNYVSNVVNLFDVDRYSLKADHKVTRSDSLSVAFSYSIGDPYFVMRGTPANYGN